MKKYILLLNFFCLFSASLFANDYYVSTIGSDSNNGSLGSPWKTIYKACTSVAANAGHTINIGEGTFVESQIISIPSGVNFIGAGSEKTMVKVNFLFSLTDAVPNANPHVNTFSTKFVLQMNGKNQTIKGFSLDGQTKTCHGGIFASYANNVVFDDLKIENFRYCGLWVLEAQTVTVQYCSLKDNTYGNTSAGSAGGGDSGSLQYHRGANFTIHDTRIEETGCVEVGKGGYCMKGQNLSYGASTMPLENMKIYNNVLIAPNYGAWNNFSSPGFCAEFLTVKLKNLEIFNNNINNVISMPSVTVDWGGRIHHNNFNLGKGRYAYALEMSLSDMEVDHNYFYGGLYPLGTWDKAHSNHIIHHNIFDNVCSGSYAGRELLHYVNAFTTLKFYNNTVIDNQDIGKIFDFVAGATDVDIRNNIFYRTYAKDDWGTSTLTGTISTNYFKNVPIHGTASWSGDPKVTLSGAKIAPYFQLLATSPCIDAGAVIAGITDGYSGVAPDLGAFEYGVTPWVVGPQAGLIPSKVADLHASLAVNIYPNPSKGLLNIEFSSSQKTNISVYDIFGKTIITKLSTEPKNQLDLSKFKGLFLVKVENKEGMICKKVIVE